MSETPPEEPTQSLPVQPPPPVQRPVDPALHDALTAAHERNAGPGISKATLILGGAVLLAGGFFGGYALKGTTGNTAAQGGFNRAGGQFPGGGYGLRGGAGGGQPGGAGGPGNATIGTVTSVSGSTVTITTANGRTVKVTAGSGTKVTVSKTGKVSDLASGDSVVVRGTADSNGNVTADSISQGSFGGIRRAQAPPS